MKLGFVSALFPDLSLEAVVGIAAVEGYRCVELMCWPRGDAERRYGGVTHVDVTDFTEDDAKRVLDVVGAAGIEISGLGYYPNPLSPVPEEAELAIAHIQKVMKASSLLGINQMNTFIGRDWTRSVEDNWPRFREVWPPLVKRAEELGVRIGIENCPMLFSPNEWPGGKNLAHSPAIWRRMFEEIPSPSFGLNYDPSHLVWLQIDPVEPLFEFGEKIFHTHAKDARIDRRKLNDVGILACPTEYHTPKIPGLGAVDWGRYFSVLGDLGYAGPVCVEVEDRAYEGSLELRKKSLRQSARFLRTVMPG